MRVITILAFLFSAVSFANHHTIPTVAPKGIDLLTSKISPHYAPENDGPHGLVEYCYKAGSYVVYSTNLLGFGLQLSSAKPETLKCVNSNTNILPSNKLGMHIGMSKKQFTNLANVEQVNDYQELIWLTKSMYNGKEFDLQTYLTAKFENNKLVWLSVFTTETN